MISGLVFEVPGTELQQLIGARAERWRRKLAQIESELATSRDLRRSIMLVTDDALVSIGGPMPPDAPESFVHDAMVHLLSVSKNQSEALTFLAAHVVEGETYRLSAQDLAYLGLAGRWDSHWPPPRV